MDDLKNISLNMNFQKSKEQHFLSGLYREIFPFSCKVLFVTGSNIEPSILRSFETLIHNALGPKAESSRAVIWNLPKGKIWDGALMNIGETPDQGGYI